MFPVCPMKGQSGLNWKHQSKALTTGNIQHRAFGGNSWAPVPVTLLCPGFFILNSSSHTCAMQIKWKTRAECSKLCLNYS